MKPLVLYFATDLHGSGICFRKFLRAPAHYDADIGILGGDLCGHKLVYIVQITSDRYECHFDGKAHVASGAAELSDLTRRLEDIGIYWHLVDATGITSPISRGAGSEVSEKHMAVAIDFRIRQWLTLAAGASGVTGTRYYMVPGNDDPIHIDGLLAESNTVRNVDDQHVQLPSGFVMLGIGGSNETPWKTAREFSEAALRARLDKLFQQASDPRSVVLISHTPPFNSGLDLVPSLSTDFQVQYGPGGLLQAPAGSTAVRAAIEMFQPVLVLCGHVHESQGYARIGRTLVLNPGSEYGAGILRGVVVSLDNKEVVDFHFVQG